MKMVSEEQTPQGRSVPLRKIRKPDREACVRKAEEAVKAARLQGGGQGCPGYIQLQPEAGPLPQCRCWGWAMENF